MNRLAIQDLEVVGQALLGNEFKENQRKKRDGRLKQIAQIHEAVDFFQEITDERRQGLQALIADATPCSWEIEYADLFSENNYELN